MQQKQKTWRFHNAQKWSFGKGVKCWTENHGHIQMHCLKNVSYSLNFVVDFGHNAASRSTSPFRMLVRR